MEACLKPQQQITSLLFASRMKRVTIIRTYVANKSTLGLFGWPRAELWTGALSAAPNMLLVGPPGGTGLCGCAAASGDPNIPLLFPPTKTVTQTNVSSLGTEI